MMESSEIVHILEIPELKEERYLLRGGAGSDPAFTPRHPRFMRFMKWDMIGVETVTTSGILESKELLISRILCALCIAVSIGWTLGTSGPSYGLWFTYLTEWNQMLAFIYFIFAIFSQYKEVAGLLQEFPGRQITFVLFETSFSLTFTVVVLFWAVIFPTENVSAGVEMFQEVTQHGIIGVWLILEFTLNRILFTLSHIVWVLLFAILYLVWNAIYTIEVSPIYSVLTYQTPYSAGIVIGGLILVAIFFFIGFGLSRLRDRLLKAQPLTATVPGGSPGGETFDGIDLELEDPSVPDIRAY